MVEMEKTKYAVTGEFEGKSRMRKAGIDDLWV
jgi:hypothetical protein